MLSYKLTNLQCIFKWRFLTLLLRILWYAMGTAEFRQLLDGSRLLDTLGRYVGTVTIIIVYGYVFNQKIYNVMYLNRLCKATNLKSLVHFSWL